MRVTYKNSQESFCRLAKFNFLALKKRNYIGMICVYGVGAVLMFFIIGPFALIFAAMAAAYVPLSLLMAKSRVKKAFAKNPAFNGLTYEFTFDEANEESFHALVTRVEQGKGKAKTKKKETVVPYCTVLRACKDVDRIYLYFSESTVIVPLSGVEGGSGKELEALIAARVGNRFTTGKIDYTQLRAEIQRKQQEKAQAEPPVDNSTPPDATEQENTLPLAEEKE